jgi:hypothetical protein
MKIKNWTLEEFARHAKKYWPKACKAHPLPTEGCMPAVEQWLKDTGIGIPGFIDKVKTATGKRAWALYECAAQGWVPGQEAVELIKSAPGNQDQALYWCAHRSWITYKKVENYLKTLHEICREEQQ